MTFYLYTIMMHAWDLDKDTHSHFRGYLEEEWKARAEGFINKRKISNELREFVLNTRSRAIASHIRPNRDVKDDFNELRISLPRRVHLTPTQCGQLWSYEYMGSEPPNLIEKIHPPKYYHNARKLIAPSRPHTNP